MRCWPISPGQTQQQDPAFVRRMQGEQTTSSRWFGRVFNLLIGVLALATALAILLGESGTAAGLAMLTGTAGLVKYLEEVG